jgi:hypothetical protein
MKKWASVGMELATPADMHLQTFDYTKLSAINMCPTWGIIRYTKHKAMPGSGRSMALEAGSAMHECFGVVRLIQLGYVQKHMDHMNYQGVKQFGKDRWDTIAQAASHAADVDIAIRNAALECLSTAGYVDDPFDRRRTYANLETSLLYYTQRWDYERYPVWVTDAADPTSFVGVETPFAVKITAYADEAKSEIVTQFLYTGRIDGLHVDKSYELLIQENKTASRIDDAWRMSFNMSHQVTGYAVAASLFAMRDVSRGLVIGLTIPLPRTLSDGLAIEFVRREDFMKARWLEWVEYTIGIHEQYKDDPLNAPKHTHSCNRYFRPCSYIPLCASDKVEQQDYYAMMVSEEWSPLHEKAGD